MEQHILGLSGVKQSGKTTTSNFIHGYQMRYNEVVKKFLMDKYYHPKVFRSKRVGLKARDIGKCYLKYIRGVIYNG
mgnify:CR=1 FL=1